MGDILEELSEADRKKVLMMLTGQELEDLKNGVLDKELAVLKARRRLDIIGTKTVLEGRFVPEGELTPQQLQGLAESLRKEKARRLGEQNEEMAHQVEEGVRKKDAAKKAILHSTVIDHPKYGGRMTKKKPL